MTSTCPICEGFVVPLNTVARDYPGKDSYTIYRFRLMLHLVLEHGWIPYTGTLGKART